MFFSSEASSLYSIIMRLDYYLTDITGMICHIAGLVLATLIFSFVITALLNLIRYYILHKAGDNSIEAKGYLCFSPRDSVHWIGLVSAFVLNIGFAAPLNYKQRKLNRPGLTTFSMCLVGPVFYFLTSLVLLFVYAMIRELNPFGIAQAGIMPEQRVWYVYAYYVVHCMIYYLVFICMFSSFANLIPVVPCAMGDFLYMFLPLNVSEFLRKNELLMSVGVFVLLFMSIGSPDGLIQNTGVEILAAVLNAYHNAYVGFIALFA